MGSSRSSQDLRRLFNGVSLVAKELLKRSELAALSQNGDVPSLVKKALVSATDLSGLTRGDPRPVRANPTAASSSHSDSKPKQSVVYFDQSTPNNNDNAPPLPPELHTSPSAAAVNAVGERDDQGACGINDLDSQAPEVVLPQIPIATTAASPATTTSATPAPATTASATPMTNVASAAKITSEVLKRRKPRERKVPSTPFTRALGSRSCLGNSSGIC